MIKLTLGLCKLGFQCTTQIRQLLGHIAREQYSMCAIAADEERSMVNERYTVTRCG